LFSVNIHLGGTSIGTLLQFGSNGGTLFVLRNLLLSLKGFLTNELAALAYPSMPISTVNIGIMLTSAADFNNPSVVTRLGRNDAVNSGLMPSSYLNGVATSSSNSVGGGGGRALQQQLDAVQLTLTVALPTNGLQSGALTLEDVAAVLREPGAAVILQSGASQVASMIGASPSSISAIVMSVAPAPVVSMPSATPSSAPGGGGGNNNNNGGKGSSGPDAGAIVGGILGGIAALSLVAVAVYFFVIRPRQLRSGGRLTGGGRNVAKPTKAGFRASSVAHALSFSAQEAKPKPGHRAPRTKTLNGISEGDDDEDNGNAYDSDDGQDGGEALEMTRVQNPLAAGGAALSPASPVSSPQAGAAPNASLNPLAITRTRPAFTMRDIGQPQPVSPSVVVVATNNSRASRISIMTTKEEGSTSNITQGSGSGKGRRSTHQFAPVGQGTSY
jgi:hypothetical protein